MKFELQTLAERSAFGGFSSGKDARCVRYVAFFVGMMCEERGKAKRLCVASVRRWSVMSLLAD